MAACQGREESTRGGAGEDSEGYRVVEAGRGPEGVWMEGREGKMTPALLCARRGRVGEEGGFCAETGAWSSVLVHTGGSTLSWALCVQAEPKG